MNNNFTVESYSNEAYFRLVREAKMIAVKRLGQAPKEESDVSYGAGGGGRYTFALQPYFGLMAIAGAYLIKEKFTAISVIKGYNYLLMIP